MLVADANRTARYELKAGKYSSHSLLLDRLPAPGNGRRVLDVGCAQGFLAAILASRGYSVVGVDFPGAARPDTFEFHGANLDEGLGPVGYNFDLILCADVLEHLRDPLRMLHDCRARLAPGGALVASLPNSGHWYFRANILAGRFPRHDKGLFDRTHLHFYMWDDWVALFSRAGLRLETVDPSAVPFELALPSLDGTFIVTALEHISYRLARLWKRLFAYQFVVVAR
jgi:SAM-dependent methyltransferase